MDFKEKLQEKVTEHNQIVEQIERLTAQRHAIIGQVELLQELAEAEASKNGSEPKQPKAKA